MPIVKCPKCGWVLKYKDCYCTCGEKLIIKEE